MFMLALSITILALAACLSVPPAATAAQDSNSSMDHGSATGARMSMHGDHKGEMHMHMDMMRADHHAPLGVAGGDTMMKDMWMLSYRYMRMEMQDNLIGTDNVSPEQIVASIPNRFFGMPGQPPTLRVVPTEMTMEMHMLGAMYAPADRVTLMGMIPYIEKSMDHITFRGPRGTTRRGEFTTRSSGMGDVKLMALYRVWHAGSDQVHLNFGLSLPTGSIDESDDVLAPTGARPTLRLPYPMQLGSGTYDLMPGVTYKGRVRNIGWGAQYQATIRLGENDENYTLGDLHQATAWGNYSWTPAASVSLRVAARTLGAIDGIDPRIVAPVQTANPNFQGGDGVDIGVGLNLSGQQGAWRGWRAGIEVGLPVYQDLDGPQMEADWFMTAGVKYMF